MKKVSDCYYVHKSNINELLGSISDFEEQINVLKAIFIGEQKTKYDVIKYNRAKKYVTLINCPTFDTMNEPEVEDGCKVSTENFSVSYVKARKNNKQIYHQKELFVSPEYKGFDIEKAKERTEQWNSIPGLDKKRIGNKNFWIKVLQENGMEV